MVWSKLTIALWACLWWNFLKNGIGVFSGRILEQENFGWKVQIQPQPLQKPGETCNSWKVVHVNSKEAKRFKKFTKYNVEKTLAKIFSTDWSILIVPPLFQYWCHIVDLRFDKCKRKNSLMSLSYDQVTNYSEKWGYFSNPPKKLCNNFFGVQMTIFWSN